jgi:hypothetical protein
MHFRLRPGAKALPGKGVGYFQYQREMAAWKRSNDIAGVTRALRACTIKTILRASKRACSSIQIRQAAVNHRQHEERKITRKRLTTAAIEM